MEDKGGSSKDVRNSSSLQIHQSDKRPRLSRDPLPLLHSSSPSPVSPPSDQAFLQAAAIFHQLRTEKTVAEQRLRYAAKTDAPQAEGGDRSAQREAFQLAFNTLKYQDLLEDIITDSCFHTSQHIPSDLLPLAMVMLFDFQDRKFVLPSSKEGEEPLQEVREMERSLLRCKTKLAASLARCRVRQKLQSVSCFLSDPVRTKQHRAKRLPLYAWVNTLKTSVEDVCEALQSTGWCEVKNISDVTESTFCRDPICPDTLVFSHHALLRHSSLVGAHELNTQDRSVCVAVSVLRPLLFEKADVLVVGSFSALTVAHVAVAAAARSGRVLVCGADHTPLQIEEIQELLTQMDVKNVRVLSEAFFGLREWDAAAQCLKVILVLPQCSSSALNNPVPTIHREHGDWDLLPDLSHGSVSQSKLQSMSAQQARLLAHALSFSKVETAVYCTRSVYPEESEQLVKRVLEKTHAHPKLLPFRVNGPIFPHDSQSGDTTESKFFRLEPSQFTNGVFAARLSRQADPTKVESVQDVLARAAAKGLLGGIVPEEFKTGKKGKNGKSKKNRENSAGSRPSSPSGREFGPDSGQEEREGGCSDEEEEAEKQETKGAKGGRNRKGPKGSKRKVKRKQGNTVAAVSKRQDQKKRTTKRKVTQRRPAKGRRRIPRLTLTLISSAKNSTLSPIAAIAQKLSAKMTIGSQSPAPPSSHAVAKATQRQSTEAERAEKTPKEAEKAESLSKARGKGGRPKEESKLPPISFPSHSAQRPSWASNSQLPQLSAPSSSSVSLPGR